MGGRYVKNLDSGEIHDRESSDERCNIDDMLPVNRTTGDKLEDMLTGKHSFCEWCFGETHVVAPRPRKTRSDAGKKKAPAKVTPPEKAPMPLFPEHPEE